VVWLRGSWLRAAIAGVVAAVLVAAPVFYSSLGTPVEARGGALAARELAPLLVFALIGNAYEELLFRGFLQGLWAERIGEARAALASGVAFAFGHLALATTLTGVGAPILVFTAYEGLICGQLRRHMGLLPAVLAHGGGIFLVASGLV
jgi:membrane protease YdiL (CAAX protease family)